ncbi:MAG TPA: hypothetical protein VFF49_07160 [Thermodesulfobacteriota bacterium]|nr:hypothetical protein [Thermodesulfobacteriota bacterium]
MKFASSSTSILRTFWAKHSTMVLTFAIALMAVLGVMKLGEEFWRLTLDSSSIGAIDLKFRYIEVRRWFEGKPVYSELDKAVYPPASYVMLWPLLGWIEGLTLARWFWAATTLVALVWLVYLVVKESDAEMPLELVFVALIPLSMNATGSTIGNGQLTVYIIPALLAGLLLLQKGKQNWSKDILASAFILFALVKPSITVPFFWIVLFIPGRLRPALLITLGYIGLTLFAVSFQEPGLLSLIHDWTVRISAVAVRVEGGYANLSIWLAALGLEELSLPASLFALVALGFWIFLHRHMDIWLNLGVTAIVARFWTYHRWYDDLLILLPMITLFRIAKQDSSADRSDVIAGVLFAITVLAMFTPYRVLYLPSPWSLLFTGGHAIVWIVVLIFLLYQAYQEKKYNGYPINI